MGKIIGADNAVHPQPGILPQQLTQEETANEPGCPGQQDLAESIGKHWTCQRAAVNALANESSQ